MASPWKVLKVQPLNDSKQIAAYRQILGKERKIAMPKIKKDINDKTEYLSDYNNSYMGIYKSPEKKKQELKQKRTSLTLAYDMTMRDTKPLPYHQKSKKDSMWDKHVKPRELPKSALGTPMTTSQTYGWMTPIDDLRTNHNRTGMCKKTFMDPGHLG